MKDEQITELLLQSLETELGGVEIYQTALKCVLNAELQEELKKYLAQTAHHVEVVRGIFEDLGLDPDASSPGREVVHDIGASLVKAMKKALSSGPRRRRSWWRPNA